MSIFLVTIITAKQNIENQDTAIRLDSRSEARELINDKTAAPAADKIPNLHEAIAATPAKAESDTIIEEIEAGYKLGDELLRPARVVVAT